MGAAEETRRAATARDALPRRFGAYHLFDRIGRGGMADIYLARAHTEVGVGRRVVVKEILADLSRDERFARMLIEEAKLVCQLRHANVVQVFDLGREGERLFIAMEYVEGFDLNQLLRQVSQRRIGLPAQFALFVVREILAALDYAHRATTDAGVPIGVVHRDVSPSNVLISFEGEVKLCDFGIAKAFGSSVPPGAERGSDDESTGERAKVAGKAAYMSPEQARGEEIDARCDLFAAGIVLWELCAGRRLYRGDERQMLELAREGAIPPLPERGLPDTHVLQAILDRALAFDPAKRFPTAEAMLRALDEYAIGAKLFASQIRFGAFLSEHFEQDVVSVRRDRERAAEALAVGPPVQIQPVAPSAPPPAASPPASPPTVEPPPEPSRPSPLRIAAIAALLLCITLVTAVTVRLLIDAL
ncbi:MAG: serine/threonine protein kinase [Sandaracinaceae bacterium]|nr:serine/threonine protein kinase [Sandaracinaceae bacterium]